MFSKVKFRGVPGDLFDPDGKLDKVIDEEDVSFDGENRTNPVEVIFAFIKNEGRVNTIVSMWEKGLAIDKDIKPTNDVCTTVCVVDTKLALWNLIGVKSDIVTLHTSIWDPSELWLEIITLYEESTMGGVRIDWTDNEKGVDKELVDSPIIVM